MIPHKKNAFFLKNGKSLKNNSTNCYIAPSEPITSLFEPEAGSPENRPRSVLNIQKLKQLVTNGASFKPKNLKTTHVWAASSVFMFAIVSLMFLFVPWKNKPVQQDKYSIYASTPLTLRDMTYSIYTKDSRAQKVNAVFKKYKCPLEGLGEVFVYEADKYNIPWWLVAAISFQESGCGKKTPEPSGLESYNAWGWAVYGDNVQTFDNWVRGIETVSEYMSEKFYKKGISDTCDIMKTYTPPSQGSWCEGVQFFGDEIQNYTTSETTL